MALSVAPQSGASDPSTSYRNLQSDVWARHAHLLSKQTGNGAQPTLDAALTANAQPKLRPPPDVDEEDGSWHIGVVHGLKGKLRARDHPRWHLVRQVEALGDADEASSEPRKTSQAELIGRPGGLGPNFIPAEITIRNDSSQRFVDTGCGQLPGSSVRNPDLASRFQEYPRLEKLLHLKGESLARHSPPPYYIQADLRGTIMESDNSNGNRRQAIDILSPDLLGQMRFDAIVIDAPLETYEWDDPTGAGSAAWDWSQIASLPVSALAAKESFIFIWVGSGAGDGLERGREILAKWGYRRCEDIVWVRADSEQARQSEPAATTAFTRTAQHCLMGIRGTVRRSRDHHFVHCNVDTDVILWPGEVKESSASASDGTSKGHKLIDVRKKPPELVALAEHFCLGTRRLQLFGDNRGLRRGWISIGDCVGPDQPGWAEAERGLNACAAGVHGAGPAPDGYVQPPPQPFDRASWQASVNLESVSGDPNRTVDQSLLPFDAQIDELRPKSPTRQAGRVSGPQAAHSPTLGWNGTHLREPRGDYIQGSTMRAAPLTRPLEAGLPYNLQPGMLAPQQFSGSWAPSGLPTDDAYTSRQTALHATLHAPGGAGLSGLGAGGPRTVSIPSGNDTLSGPQASVLLGRATRGIGPTGLGRPR
ncbi:Predicted N6-adenine methylase involved in transcription regulation [Ceraceosorus bombacis]|uniref:Predicted N6-adenine methylase involved in transcription regulation n=1 Tax=Ceraceosorus bombacis TaxID=401625 RepID=A0A0P1BE79_9BASI|nr:Predicted N6-adenine methylase involved in transcription regulation [Ceraceosorus bombacis]